jgi:ATP:ADP antiporter, AAA family
MKKDTQQNFSKWKSLIWPIYKEEYAKFIPMFFILFLITFNYNLLRATKDTLVVTAPSSGAEALAFIKVWIILPSAILITYIFTRLSNRFGKEKVFYLMTGIFLIFFIIFVCILYPMRDYIHPNNLADKVQSLLPSGLKGLIALFRNWTLTSFYVMAELWGTAVLTVLFWGFANEVTSIMQAKRFYILFGAGANIAAILAGRASSILSKNSFNHFIPYGKTAWDQSVLFISTTIIIIGILIMLLFRYLNKNVIAKEELNSPNIVKTKIKMSMRKNFSYLAKSKYLISIAIIVLTYNLATNLVELVWKNQLKALYPNPSDYNNYMGYVITMTGIIATISAFLMSGMLRKFTWTFNAILSPLIILSTGLAFFSFFFFSSTTLAGIATLFGTTPLIMNVFFGTMQHCLSRAAKYTVFDSTKEIAFIPLSPESKLKGKAAIDGVGSRIGKSGGSIVHQGLLLGFSTIAIAAPYVAGIFTIVAIFWMISVVSLGKQHNSLLAQDEKLKIPEKDEKKDPVPVN